MSTTLRIPIPRTELAVSPLCLGAAQFGSGLTEEASFAILDAFVEAGGNFIDTAHIYNDFASGAEKSISEKTIGRWRKSRGDTATVVTTKGGHPPPQEPRVRRVSAEPLRQDIEEALVNLSYSQLPIFYLHRDDPNRPAAEILGELEPFRDEGLILHYAASNWATERLAEAHAAARAHGYQGFVANQAAWSLARRNPGTAPGTNMDLSAMDDPMIRFHTRTGLAAIPYWTQAKGYFDKYVSGNLDAEAKRCYDSLHSRSVGDALARVAKQLDATPTQVMLAVQRRSPFTTIPIVGCRSPEQVRSSFASLALDISEEDVVALNEVAGFKALAHP
jgi:aryl-alcohol dehydrogenase-like predicted oxidoreductase